MTTILELARKRAANIAYLKLLEFKKANPGYRKNPELYKEWDKLQTAYTELSDLGYTRLND